MMTEEQTVEYIKFLHEQTSMEYSEIHDKIVNNMVLDYVMAFDGCYPSTREAMDEIFPLEGTAWEYLYKGFHKYTKHLVSDVLCGAYDGYNK